MSICNRKLRKLTDEERLEWRRAQIREAGRRYRDRHRDELNEKRRLSYAEKKAEEEAEKRGYTWFY